MRGCFINLGVAFEPSASNLSSHSKKRVHLKLGVATEPEAALRYLIYHLLDSRCSWNPKNSTLVMCFTKIIKINNYKRMNFSICSQHKHMQFWVLGLWQDRLQIWSRVCGLWGSYMMNLLIIFRFCISGMWLLSISGLHALHSSSFFNICPCLKLSKHLIFCVQL